MERSCATRVLGEISHPDGGAVPKPHDIPAAAHSASSQRSGDQIKPSQRRPHIVL